MDTLEQSPAKKKGGRREGSGRKKLPPDQKKQIVNVALPGWLLSWMATQNASRAVLIEQAMTAQFNLKHD